MTTKKFSKGEAIRFGWNTMKSNLGFFIYILIVAGLIVYILPITGKLTKENIPILSTIISIVSWVLNLVIGMGLIKIALRFCDNKKVKFTDLFSCFPLFFKYLFGLFLYGIIAFGGIMLTTILATFLMPHPIRSRLILFGILINIPGIIFAIKFYFFNYFIVEKGLGPIEALKKSSAITKGAKWDLFVFGLLLLAINLLGALCLLIGLFATIPTSMVALAFVYRRLLAQNNFLKIA